MTHPERAPAQKPRTLSIGGATTDLFVSLAENCVKTVGDQASIVLPLGHKIRASDVVETGGGGAANTSVGLSRLGCDAAFCGIMGSDQWGERLLATLKKEGVETCCATIVEGENSSFSIILRSETGERVILCDPGTNAHLHDATFDREHAETSQWIYLNHLHEQATVIVDDILAVFDQNPAIGLSWNPGGNQIRKGMADTENAAMLRHTRLLLLNKEEALAFTKDATVEDALRTLTNAGATVVCITDGDKGSTASDGKSIVFCPAIAGATIVDTTGAGDGFGTAATWSLIQGLPLPTMLAAGTINATSVLGEIGAQAGLLTDIEIRRRLSDTHLDVTVRAL